MSSNQVPAIKKSVWKSLWTKPMLVTLLMGFSSGIPLLLTLRTLQAWMTESGVDLKTVGIFVLAGTPYSLKFLWAPFMDRYNLFGFGRRRGWLLVTQFGLIMALMLMAITNPKDQTWLMAFFAFLVSFFSASQDIVVDAFRRESLPDEDLGLGSSFYYYGYRIAMWVSGGAALAMAEFTSWKNVYFIMAATIFVGIFTTIWSEEPESSANTPKSLREAVVEPFMEFISRSGAWYILSFVLLYKIGDVMAGNMLTPFYLKMGYSKLEIAAIAKTMNLPITIIGGFIGGAAVHNWGIKKCLWIFGILQIIATFAFNLLLFTGHSLWSLGTVIIIEDLATSMATAAFVAFMASMTNKKFSATQYALLSSLMGVPRNVLSAPTGYLIEALGWFGFFSFCTLVAIPGMLLIIKIFPNQKS
jgi:PAT family beta-lactamase induction signal transducer AmpG